MPDLSNLSEEELTELYSQISEMVEEDISPSEIADGLELSVKQVKRICDELGIDYKKRSVKIRALTRSEFRDFKQSRKRGETIASISRRMGINPRFLRKMDTRVKFIKTCLDCHTRIKKSHFLCAVCSKRRQNDRVIARQKQRYKEDPEFRAKWIQDVKAKKKA